MDKKLRKKKMMKKIFANVILRKSKYFRRNLAINHEFTDIKVVKIKSQKDILSMVGALSTIETKDSYLIEHINYKFNTNNFNSIVDLVFTNHNHKIIKLITNVLPNTNIEYDDNVKNIWILAHHTINYLGLKLDDNFDTK